jgi:hypothetical protein
VKVLVDVLKWDTVRSAQTLEFLEGQGMAWIDDGGKEREWCRTKFCWCGLFLNV